MYITISIYIKGDKEGTASKMRLQVPVKFNIPKRKATVC